MDSWGQKVYAKQQTDDFGTPMYEKIKSEPDKYHVDKDGDGKCDRCGATIKKEEPGHSHSYEKKVVTTEPTCTTEGAYEMQCPEDSAKGETGTIPALGHEDENSDGICDRCGASVGATR
ncbi:MAG: hypothetical protein V8Q27_04055 [Eubacteriales bacterium]